MDIDIFPAHELHVFPSIPGETAEKQVGLRDLRPGGRGTDTAGNDRVSGQRMGRRTVESDRPLGPIGGPLRKVGVTCRVLWSSAPAWRGWRVR